VTSVVLAVGTPVVLAFVLDVSAWLSASLGVFMLSLAAMDWQDYRDDLDDDREVSEA
jgi:hypothetical protein